MSGLIKLKKWQWPYRCKHGVVLYSKYSGEFVGCGQKCAIDSTEYYTRRLADSADFPQLLTEEELQKEGFIIED